MTEVKLTLTDKAQVIGITALLAAGLTGLSLWWLVPDLRIKTDPNDAPIAMAGGSFHVHASGDATMRQDTGKLVHTKKKKVYEVDIIDPNGKMTVISNFKQSEEYAMGFLYCDPLGCAQGQEWITVAFNNKTAGGIDITGTYDDVNGVFDHPKKTWILNRVTFSTWPGGPPPPAPKPADTSCTPSGRCTVIIRTK